MDFKKWGKIILAVSAILTLTTSAAYAEEYSINNDLVHESVADSILINDDVIVEHPSFIDCTTMSARATSTVWDNSYNAYSVEKMLVVNWGIDDNVKINVRVKNNGSVPIRLGAYNGSAVGGTSDIKTLTIPAYSTKTMTINGNEISASLNEDIWIGSVLFKLQDANFEENKINCDVTATVTK